MPFHFDGKRLRDDDGDGNDDADFGCYIDGGGGGYEEEESNNDEDGSSCCGDSDDVMENFPGQRE